MQGKGDTAAAVQAVLHNPNMMRVVSNLEYVGLQNSMDYAVSALRDIAGRTVGETVTARTPDGREFEVPVQAVIASQALSVLFGQPYPLVIPGVGDPQPPRCDGQTDGQAEALSEAGEPGEPQQARPRPTGGFRPVVVEGGKRG